PELVAGADQRTSLGVAQREGEVAGQVIDQLLAPRRVSTEDELGVICRRVRGRAAASERRDQRGAVVQPHVGAQPNAAVEGGRPNRSLAVTGAQQAVSESPALAARRAAAVRTGE